MGTEEDGKTLGGLEVVGEAVLVLVLVVRVAGVGIDAHLFAHVLARLVVVHRAGDGDRVRVVARHDEQRVGVLGAVGLGALDHLVEGDRVAHGAGPVERVGVLVHEARLEHQEEAVLVLLEHFDGGVEGFGQIRLVRELLDGVALPLVAVDPAVHVAGVKEAEQAVGRLAGDGAEHFCAVRDELVAGVAELLDVVDAVLALGAGGFLREEVGGAAAEDDLGLDVVEHPDDVGLVGAAAGVGDDGGGRGVLDLGVAHDADGLVGLAAQKLGDRLLLRIVLAGLGAVGVDAEGVDARLVARHVGGGGVRRTTSPRPRHNCGRIGAKTVPINGERGTITRLAANVRRELAENSSPVFMANFMAKVLTHESHSKKHQQPARRNAPGG